MNLFKRSNVLPNFVRFENGSLVSLTTIILCPKQIFCLYTHLIRKLHFLFAGLSFFHSLDVCVTVLSRTCWRVEPAPDITPEMQRGFG